MLPRIIIEIEDHNEQGNMNKFFVFFVLLFAVTILSKPLGSATVKDNGNSRFVYTSIQKSYADRAEQLECLAKNIYFEARNEPYAGQLAVALVTLNRVQDRKFPSTICKVVYQGSHFASGHPKRDLCQFSWYCDGQPDTVTNLRAWATSQRIANTALSSFNIMKRNGLDFTEDAKYYHTFAVSPRWSKVYPKVGRIGDHIFYR